MSTAQHPPHYQQVSGIGEPILIALGVDERLLKMECLEAIYILEGNGWDFCRLNAVKCLWRCGGKNGEVEDLKTAKFYLDRWYLHQWCSNRWANSINGNAWFYIAAYLFRHLVPTFNTLQSLRENIQSVRAAAQLIEETLKHLEASIDEMD